MVLDSLRAQVGAELDARQIFLFQDGAINPFSNRKRAEKVDIEACIEAFQKAFPNQTIMASPDNLGVALNFERAERYGYETLGAPAAIFLEDDLVLGEKYIEILDRLIEQYAQDDRVGYIAAYGDHTKSLAEQKRNSSRLISLTHNWGFALYRRQWLRMRPRVLEYLKLVENVDYSQKDGRAIRRLFGSWGFGCPAISQDAAKTIACCKDDVIKINTFVCNARYIGEQGLHMTPALFRERGYLSTRLYSDPVGEFDPLDDRQYKKILREQLGWAGKPFDEHEAGNATEVDSAPSTTQVIGFEMPQATAGAGRPEASLIAGRRSTVPMAKIPDAAALFDAARVALQNEEYQIADAIFVQGTERFPEAIDQYGDPVFGKEAIRLRLSRNDIPGAQRMRRRLEEQLGTFHWDEILFARHYTAHRETEKAIGAWKAILKNAPGHAEALAGIERLEILQARASEFNKKVKPASTISQEINAEAPHRIFIPQQGRNKGLFDDVINELFGINPYEGLNLSAEPVFEQNWNSTHPALARIIKELRPKVAVEVGVWQGRSTATIARSLKEVRPDGIVIAIDTFLGSPEHWTRRRPDVHASLRFKHGRPSFYELFLANMVALNLTDSVVPLAQTSENAAVILRRLGLIPDFVHIDAAHEYAPVQRDALLYYDMLRPGGVLMGDDFSWGDVARAANDFADQIGVKLQIDHPKWIIQKPK